MPEKLKEIIARYDELERQMLLPENYTDPEAYSRLAKELKELAPGHLVACHRQNGVERLEREEGADRG